MDQILTVYCLQLNASEYSKQIVLYRSGCYLKQTEWLLCLKIWRMSDSLQLSSITADFIAGCRAFFFPFRVKWLAQNAMN